MSTKSRLTAQPELVARGRSMREAHAAVAAHLPLRRDRRIPFSRVEPDTLFCLESGCLTLDARLPDGRRQVLLALYPGDVIAHAFVPPLPDIGITAATPSQLVRLHANDPVKNSGQADGVDIQAAAARLFARSALHTIVIGRLSGEERVATLLVEMALRLGRETPGGLAFDLPLSRADMADYLALNPDTFSRLMSRFKSRNLVVMPTRRQAIAKDIEALKGASPLSAALESVCTPIRRDRV